MNPEEVDAVEENIDLQEWVSHPHTKLLLGKTEPKAKAALESLVNACKQSTDLRVVLKYAEYEHLRMLAGVLRKGQKE